MCKRWDTPRFSTQSIAIEATGTFVVTGSFPAAVVRVDPLTGAQTIVSDTTTGSGPSFGSGVLTGIVVEPTGDLVVIDEEQDTVVRVDPVTGNRTVISANAVIGSGPAVRPRSIAASATGTLFVAGAGQLVQVDPDTGMRRVVAKMSDVFTDMAVEATGTVIGVSHMPDLFCGFITRVDPTTGMRNPVVLKGCPTTVTVEATGSLVVAFRDPFPQTTLMRLDPQTLAGTPIVASRGPTLPLITSIAVEPTGTFVVVDSRLNAVARINEQTGERTIISDATTGSGPMFQYLGNIAVEATGDLVTVDPVRKAVFRINPVTGARTIVSDAIIGRGPAFFAPIEIAVEPTGTLVVADTELGAVDGLPYQWRPRDDRAVVQGEDVSQVLAFR